MDASYFQVNPELTTRRDDNRGDIIDPPKHFDISRMNENPFKRQKQLRRFRVLLDSTYRPTSCTSPSSYTLDLPEPIYGVEKIQLQRAFIPNSIYTINSNNNSFLLDINGVDYTITLDEGNYTNDELATEIETKLDAAAGTGTGWSVSQDGSSGILTINGSSVTTPAVTSLEVRASEMPNLAPIIGFGSTNVTGTTSVVSPYPMNTNQPINLLLNLAQGNDDYDSMIIPTMTGSVRCFGYIPLGVNNGAIISESAALLNTSPILVSGASGAGYRYYSIPKDTTTAYYDFYEGSKSAIQKLSVRFEQLLPDGTVVTPDFNNGNHIIELELIAQVDKLSSII